MIYLLLIFMVLIIFGYQKRKNVLSYNTFENPNSLNEVNFNLLKMEAKPLKKKFVIGKAPFLRSVDEGKISTTKMMVDVLIALTPIILFSWYKNGIKPFITLDGVSVLVMLWPLIFVASGALTSMALEMLYFACFKKTKGFKETFSCMWQSYAILPGIFLALLLPLYTPIWILMLGCFMANIVFKMLFGGFGHNIFNPALIAYAFVMAAFGGVISSSYLNPLEINSLVSSSTPLAILNDANVGLGGTYDQLVKPFGTLFDFFIGTIPGAIGETSSLLCIVAFIYLVIRKTINWFVPVIYVGCVFLLTFIIGGLNGNLSLWYPTYQILSGGLLFGAVFMATEPVTSPKTPSGKVVFAFFLGIFTVLFRCKGQMNEGVATSILFMCLFSRILDGFMAKIRSSSNIKSNAIKLSFLVLFMVILAFYTVFQCAPKKEMLDAFEILTKFGGIK